MTFLLTVDTSRPADILELVVGETADTEPPLVVVLGEPGVQILSSILIGAYTLLGSHCLSSRDLQSDEIFS